MLKGSLPPELFERGWDEGRRLRLEEAVELSRGVVGALMMTFADS